MKDTIIVQYKTGGSIDEYDWLIRLEDALIQAFAQNNKAKVDGHDFGSGNMNIFIFPKRSWHDAFDILKAHLKHHDALRRSIVILRRKSGAYRYSPRLLPGNLSGYDFSSRSLARIQDFSPDPFSRCASESVRCSHPESRRQTASRYYFASAARIAVFSFSSDPGAIQHQSSRLVSFSWKCCSVGI